LGFHLILYPLAGLFAAAKAMQSIYEKLKTDETTLGTDIPQMTFPEFNDLIGVEEKYKMAARFGAE